MANTVTPVHIIEMLEAPEVGRFLVEDNEVGTLVISGSIKNVEPQHPKYNQMIKYIISDITGEIEVIQWVEDGNTVFAEGTLVKDFMLTGCSSECLTPKTHQFHPEAKRWRLTDIRKEIVV